MNDDPMVMDPVLRDLGAAEEQAQQVPERWRRLVSGEASATEVAALREQARSDPETAVLWARFCPLDETEDEQIVGAMVEQVRSGRRHRGRRAWIGVGVAAAAATVVVGIGGSSVGNLPGYALEASAPDLDHRGEARPPPGELPRHAVGSALSLILRPEVPVKAEVAISTYLILDDRAEPLELEWRVSPQGAARLDGAISELFPGRSGPLTLLAVVHPADRAAPAPESIWAARRDGEPPSSTRWLEYRFEVSSPR